MIYCLLIILCLVFLITIYCEKGRFGAPAVVFAFSFLFSAMWACAYANKWNVTIGSGTFFVVLTGVVCFSIGCLLYRFLAMNRLKDSISTDNDQPYHIENWKIITISVIELVSAILYARAIQTGAGSNALSEAIFSIYSRQQEANIPLYLRVLLAAMRGSGYWFSYVVVKNYYVTKKIDWLKLIPIFISVVGASLTGSRGTAICVLISVPAFLFVVDYRKNGSKRHLQIKKIAVFIILLAIGLWCFPRILGLLGRTSRTQPTDYIAAYVGAEIYNLDHYITNYSVPMNMGTWGSMTFYSIESTLAKYFGLNVLRPYNAYPYLFSNGLFMGNVYTTFYEWLYDFGYVGCFLGMIVYGFISQHVFEKARRCSDQNHVPMLVLLYGYMFPLIFVSFFAWWIGVYVISTSFVYILLSWWVLNEFCFKLKISIKRAK